MNTQRLSALSDKPIVVVNNYLGYEISFMLVDFWVQYGSFGGVSVRGVSSLDNDNIQSSFFAVVSSFSDIAPDNSRIKQRRDDTYKLSSNYFFKHFANNTLTDNKFVLHINGSKIDHLQYFAIKDTLFQKSVSLIPDTDINEKPELYSGLGQELTGTIGVLDGKNIQSNLYFMTDSFLIDHYGNIDKIDKILFKGQMGNNRAGDMLPIDYE